AKQIPVRIVVDRRQAKGSHSGVKTLLQGGIELKYGHQRGIMHNKFVIVDGRALETGSFNHTHHAATANNENQIYLFKSAIVSRYRKRFEKLWAEGDR
ncbi:MAG: phospholipase D-like domain-containing protein, partial [Bdellovibrionota bacterium]